MTVDGREITIDEQGARWAYSIGFWNRRTECPFILGTPHQVFWLMGVKCERFPKNIWPS